MNNMIDTLINNTAGSSGGLKIITLSGTETVTKNMTLYEYNDTIIAIDCGVDFPDNDMLGVNVVIPDFTYLRDNRHKFKALIITHGHEDHIGAIPFLMEEFDVPIYAGKLVQGFIREKLGDKQFKPLLDKLRFHEFSPSTAEVKIGAFSLSAFRVNHSVPEATGISINTPEGRILHMADYKIDWTPVIDKPIDLGRIASYGESGVLCLLSDCLGVTHEGRSKSEATLNDTFVDLFDKYESRQILVTTISSNISRMYQIISAAAKIGKKVVFSGRSIKQNTDVAKKLGYLPFDESIFVDDKIANEYDQKSLVYIIAGCYGQEDSALGKVSRNENRYIQLEEDAAVIFSADPNPPGVDIAVDRMMAQLTTIGAEVIYSGIQDNLHVSGHGTRDDLMTIAAVVKPRYYLPIGGTITKMKAYSRMVESLGVSKDRVLEPTEGDCILFERGTARMGTKLEVKQVYIGGQGAMASQIDPILLKDRDQMCTDGVFVVLVPVSRKNNQIFADKIDIVTRGFIYVKESREFMDRSRKFITKTINKHQSKGLDWGSLRRKIENDVDKYIRKEEGRTPMVIVHS